MPAGTNSTPPSRVAVVGGSVAGLAAAERVRSFAAVDLYERQRYDEKRVICGEAINDVSLIPLAKTPDNGFVNSVRAFDVECYRSTDHDTDEDPVTTVRLRAEDGYVTDRTVVEREWAERLRDASGVTIHEGENVSVRRYRELVETYDCVVDATGHPALTTKAHHEADAYTGTIVALSGDVDGNFSGFVDFPRVVFEGYLGYFWLFPKSEHRANVGVGWVDEARPDDYLDALWAACDRAGVSRPERSAVDVDAVPQGPSLPPAFVRPESNVFLVGDAAGIANRYQGEGICQAIRSSYLLADLLERGRAAAYPERLYESMKAEFRLARVMRGVLEETDDAELLADVADAVDGLTVDDVTRRPNRVFRRLLSHPVLLARLLTTPGLCRRVWDAYHDRWEFGTVPYSRTIFPSR